MTGSEHPLDESGDRPADEIRVWAEQLSADTPDRTIRILEGVDPVPADLAPVTLAALRMLWIRHGSPGATSGLSRLLPEL